MNGVAVGFGLLVIVYTFFVLVFSNKAADVRTPRGVMRRLRRPGARITISATGVFGNPGIWNPGKPIGPGNAIFQPGVATYWLDSDGQVHLDWKSKMGHQSFVGDPPPPKVHDESTRIMLWTMLIGGLFGLGVGYLFGALGESGRHPAAHILLGLAGLAIAGIALYVVEHRLRRKHRANPAA